MNFDREVGGRLLKFQLFKFKSRTAIIVSRGSIYFFTNILKVEKKATAVTYNVTIHMGRKA